MVLVLVDGKPSTHLALIHVHAEAVKDERVSIETLAVGFRLGVFHAHLGAAPVVLKASHKVGSAWCELQLQGPAKKKGWKLIDLCFLSALRTGRTKRPEQAWQNNIWHAISKGAHAVRHVALHADGGRCVAGGAHHAADFECVNACMDTRCWGVSTIV